MNRDEFRILITDTAQRFITDAEKFITIQRSLPMLPAGVEYDGLSTFPMHGLAACILRLTCTDRLLLTQLLTLFVPVPLVRQAGASPEIRPRHTVTDLTGWTDIFPLTFNIVQVETGEGVHNHVCAIWYYRPDGQNFPWLRIFLVCYLPEDKATISTSGETNMPNGIVILDNDISTPDGSRLANIYWNPVPISDWLSNFDAEDEWPQLIN